MKRFIYTHGHLLAYAIAVLSAMIAGHATQQWRWAAAVIASWFLSRLITFHLDVLPAYGRGAEDMAKTIKKKLDTMEDEN